MHMPEQNRPCVLLTSHFLFIWIAVGFLVNTLHNLSGPLSMVLYLSYSALMSWCLFLAMGTVGFLASFIFTVKIFEAVKAD
jgi:transmembrane 9 superfamily protein 2/4